ncbi:ACP S-malonyltransferase [Alteromonadaceae bacterium M269]|nr:ACP S-malonyltransferase [Alteromonadaceae bacterium M269]
MTPPRKETAVVVCPGRGTYNKDELGYFHRHHSDKLYILEPIDALRTQLEQVSVSELDKAARYQMKMHTAGENASALIYACAKGDYESIDLNQYDIKAITGNSMGWYIALALSNALNAQSSIELINTMGSMMTDGIIGGQLIYPVVDENWHVDPQLLQEIDKAKALVANIEGAEVYDSIYLGGYLVLGGNQLALEALQKALPPIQDRYPMGLHNHAAFHTPLLDSISKKARAVLSPTLFQTPDVPLVDGRGHIWQPYATNLDALYEYTLGHQVTEPYDFSKAIEVSLKEFAPDKVIILGPGATLGGAIGQCLVQHQWLEIGNKADFIQKQKEMPFVLSMGMPEQRTQVVI